MVLRSPLCRLSRALFCVVPALSVLFAPISARASKDSVPDWVRAAIAQPQPPYSAETSAVVLLDETILTVGNDGKAVERHRHVVKILRPKGREEALVEIPYDKDSKILSLHVWSVGPDGHEYAMKDNEIEDSGYPGSGGLYFDDRERTAKAPGRDPGGVVAYESEQRLRPYVHEHTWYFQDDIPQLNQSFTLELPPGYNYQTTWAHHAEVKASDLEHQRYRWEMASTPAIDLERVPLHPSFSALAGRMTVHYGPSGGTSSPLGTWQELGEWYDGVSRDRLVANPDIAAKAAELTAGKTDFYDKAEAVGEFVQKQVRYFVIEMGIGGWQPHPAADIFHNRYGDCKDKATVLSAMLSSVGIHSALMLVDTRRGVIDPASPSMSGNHMIGAIEIPKGYDSPKLRSVVTTKSGRRYLIFDPTWEMTAFGQLENNLQGSYGVLMEGKDTEAIQLPLLSPDLNRIQRSAKLQLQVDGSLKGSIVEKSFGDLSEYSRELYTQADAKEQQTELNRRLSEDFVSFNVSDVKVENVQSLNKDLTTSFNLSAERYGRNMGSLLMVRPRVLGSEGPPLDHKPRLVPIDLKQTMEAKDDFTIEVPAGYAVDEMPDPVKLDVGFASYESSTRLDGNTLHYTRTYTVRQVSLPADRYPDVQKLAATIEADEQNHAVFKKQQ
jgi:hypothetical protein